MGQNSFGRIQKEWSTTSGRFVFEIVANRAKGEMNEKMMDRFRNGAVRVKKSLRCSLFLSLRSNERARRMKRRIQKRDGSKPGRPKDEHEM